MAVTEIKDAKGFSALTDAMNAQFSNWNLKSAEQTKNYLAALHGKLNSSDMRLLLVKGNASGKTKIDAVSGKLPNTIEVAVVPTKTFKIAFRFIQLTDDSDRRKRRNGASPTLKTCSTC